MSRLTDFLSYLHDKVDNHSIYVWGGQGEQGDKVTEAWIRKMETGEANATRAIRYWKKQVDAGYGRVLSAFDCSGLAVFFLMNYGILQYDTTANGLRGFCKQLARNQLRKGDWVFRVSNGNAYHIGFVVDDNLRVIEAKGRDDGLVNRTLNANGDNYWNAYGRPLAFFPELGGAGEQPPATPQEVKPDGIPELAKVLKLQSPYMKGTEVQQAQRFLLSAKCNVGSTGADGIFGGGTQAAVKAYQKEKKLTVDGKIGKMTWQAFGGKWTGR